MKKEYIYKYYSGNINPDNPKIKEILIQTREWKF